MLKTIIAAAIIAIAWAGQTRAQDQGIELGVLDCAIAGGTGFIFGSSKGLSCTFTPADKNFSPEAYSAPSTNMGWISAPPSRRSCSGWC